MNRAELTGHLPAVHFKLKENQVKEGRFNRSLIQPVAKQKEGLKIPVMVGNVERKTKFIVSDEEDEISVGDAGDVQVKYAEFSEDRIQGRLLARSISEPIPSDVLDNESMSPKARKRAETQPIEAFIQKRNPLATLSDVQLIADRRGVVVKLMISLLEQDQFLKAEGIFRVPGNRERVNKVLKGLGVLGKLQPETLFANGNEFRVYDCCQALTAILNAETLSTAFKEEILKLKDLIDEYALVKEELVKFNVSNGTLSANDEDEELMFLDENSLESRLIEEQLGDIRYKMDKIYQELGKVSPRDFELLDRITTFLAQIARHSDINKMKPYNLAMVFAPVLFKADVGAASSLSIQERMIVGLKLNASGIAVLVHLIEDKMASISTQ